MKSAESALLPIGFIALLLLPTLVVYFVGSFALWDLTWIADATYGDVRGATAVIQTVWLVLLLLAVSGS